MKRTNAYERIVRDALDSMGITHRVETYNSGDRVLLVSRDSMCQAFPLLSEGDAYDKVILMVSEAIDYNRQVHVSWDGRTDDELGLSVWV